MWFAIIIVYISLTLILSFQHAYTVFPNLKFNNIQMGNLLIQITTQKIGKLGHVQGFSFLGNTPKLCLLQPSLGNMAITRLNKEEAHVYVFIVIKFKECFKDRMVPKNIPCTPTLLSLPCVKVKAMPVVVNCGCE